MYLQIHSPDSDGSKDIQESLSTLILYCYRGAKIYNNKCRVNIVYTEGREKGLQKLRVLTGELMRKE